MASKQFSSSTDYVFPTEYDVHGGVSGFGRVPQELTLSNLIKMQGNQPGTVSGFAPPAASASDTGYTCSGAAVINGYIVAMQGAGTFTVDFDNAENYCYLRLIKAGAKVIEAVIEVYDAIQMPIPANSIPLWHVSVSGGLVSGSPIDWRHYGQRVSGSVKNSSSSPVVARAGTGNWSVVHASGLYFTLTFDPVFLPQPMVINEAGGTITSLTTSGCTLEIADGATMSFIFGD